MISFSIGSETYDIKFSNSFPTNEAKDNKIGKNNFITTILADDPQGLSAVFKTSWKGVSELNTPAHFLS